MTSKKDEFTYPTHAEIEARIREAHAARAAYLGAALRRLLHLPARPAAGAAHA